MSFFLNLPSNVKRDESFPQNTISNYITKLAKKYYFPPSENWEVGLSEISYPKSWYNLITPQHISLFSISRAGNTTLDILSNKTAVLSAGHYPKPRNIVTKINNIIEDKYANKLDVLPSLGYNKFTHKISYKLGSKDTFGAYFIKFDKELEILLGFIDEQGQTIEDQITRTKLSDWVKESYINNKVVAKRAVDLYSGFHTLYLYTDIIQYSGVGDTFAQILRTIKVPTEKEFGDQIVLTYDQPFYIPLLKREFEVIEVDLKNELGKSVGFELGRVIITLHFRKHGGL